MCTYNYFVVLCLVTVVQICAQDLPSYLRNIRNCLTKNDSFVCLKVETLDVLNETMYSDEPINLFGNINIVRDKDYRSNDSMEISPMTVSQRSISLTDAVHDKIVEFFRSRLIQFKLGDTFEARKSGGGGFGGGGKKGGGGGMLMLVGAAMAGLLSQLFMGKIALIAGAALLLSKMALMLSLISGLKKSSDSGGGKESAHFIYSTNGADSYGHGHGGWHRSLAYEEDPQQAVYNRYAQPNPYN